MDLFFPHIGHVCLFRSCSATNVQNKYVVLPEAMAFESGVFFFLSLWLSKLGWAGKASFWHAQVRVVQWSHQGFCACSACIRSHAIDAAPRVNSGRTDLIRIAMVCSWHSENMVEGTHQREANVQGRRKDMEQENDWSIEIANRRFLADAQGRDLRKREGYIQKKKGGGIWGRKIQYGEKDGATSYIGNLSQEDVQWERDQFW